LTFSGGGAAKRRPRLHFDHVQIAVEDLDVAAEQFESRYGLVSLSGGRHPGRGTANRIIPLGDSYLELIAVVDDAEAEHFQTSMRVRRAVQAGRTFAAWAVRTESLEETLAELGSAGFPLPDSGVADGRRRQPDGRQLAWRSAELVPGGTFSSLPFLIEWRVPPEVFPGAASVHHPAGARGVRSTILADPDPDRAGTLLHKLLTGDFHYAVEHGPAGVAAVVIDAARGELRVD
jgi:hypothetical protein